MAFLGYTTAQAAKLSSLSERQVRYLSKMELIAPSVKTTRGKGDAALYGRKDILELAVVSRLRAACGQDLKSERVHHALVAMRRPRRGSLLVLDAEGAWVAAYEQIPEALAAAHSCALVDLDAVQAHVDGQLGTGEETAGSQTAAA